MISHCFSIITLSLYFSSSIFNPSLQKTFTCILLSCIVFSCKLRYKIWILTQLIYVLHILQHYYFWLSCFCIRSVWKLFLNYCAISYLIIVIIIVKRMFIIVKALCKILSITITVYNHSGMTKLPLWIL